MPKVNGVFCSHYWLSSSCFLSFLISLSFLSSSCCIKLLLWVFHPHSSGCFLFSETVGRARNRSSSLAHTHLSPRCLNSVPGLPGRGHGDDPTEMFCSQVSGPRQSVSQSVNTAANVKIWLSSILSISKRKAHHASQKKMGYDLSGECGTAQQRELSWFSNTLSFVSCGNQRASHIIQIPFGRIMAFQ